MYASRSMKKTFGPHLRAESSNFECRSNLLLLTYYLLLANADPLSIVHYPKPLDRALLQSRPQMLVKYC